MQKDVPTGLDLSPYELLARRHQAAEYEVLILSYQARDNAALGVRV